jgi:hypothetical protein
MQGHLRSVGLVAILLAVAAVGSLAQSEAPKPATGVALGGYCPVAHVAMNHAMKGDPQHKSTQWILGRRLAGAASRRARLRAERTDKIGRRILQRSTSTPRQNATYPAICRAASLG